jgi:hypothetical protein
LTPNEKHNAAPSGAVVERADAGALKRGDVDEHVLGATFRRDETKTFCSIEKFHSASLAHVPSFFRRRYKPVLEPAPRFT